MDFPCYVSVFDTAYWFSFNKLVFHAAYQFPLSRAIFHVTSQFSFINTVFYPAYQFSTQHISFPHSVSIFYTAYRFSEQHVQYIHCLWNIPIFHVTYQSYNTSEVFILSKWKLHTSYFLCSTNPSYYLCSTNILQTSAYFPIPYSIPQHLSSTRHVYTNLHTISIHTLGLIHIPPLHRGLADVWPLPFCVDVHKDNRSIVPKIVECPPKMGESRQVSSPVHQKGHEQWVSEERHHCYSTRISWGERNTWSVYHHAKDKATVIFFIYTAVDR